MFPLLIKIRLQSGWNAAKHTARRSPVLALGLVLLGVGLFALAYTAALVVFSFAERRHVLPETVYQVFYFLFLFLLAGAVPFIASTLLHSTDYTLLFAAPIPPRAIIAAKLLDATVTNSLQFTILGIPAIVACASAAGLPILAWLLVPPIIVLFVLVPALITALGLLVALSIVGMRRLRAAISILNAIMATVVCITIVLEAGRLPMRAGLVAESLSDLHPSLNNTSIVAHAAPSAWFADLLLALAGGHTVVALERLFLCVLLVAALFYGCILLGERLLSASSVAEEGAGGRIEPSGGTGGRSLWHRFFTPPIAALIAKDFKYIARDSVLLSQLGMPLILFLVPFLLGMQNTTIHNRDELFSFTAAMTGVILFMQTSILSLSSIGLESRSFWIILGSPVRGSSLLWAKFVMSMLVSAGTGIFLALVTSLAFGVPASWFGIYVGFVVLSSAALCGLGVGIAAVFPRFVYENPAHRVSAWAMILGFFATTSYVVVTGLLFFMAWLLSMTGAYGNESRVIYGVCVALYLVLTGFASIAPIAVGARRIEGYQWEH